MQHNKYAAFASSHTERASPPAPLGSSQVKNYNMAYKYTTDNPTHDYILSQAFLFKY